MTRKLWTATLVPSSPRYQDWHGILLADDVPLLNARTAASDLGDEKGVHVYQLDLDRFTRAQMDRLIAFVVDRFHMPKREAASYIASNGFPIREADVSVCFSMRAFL